MIIPSEEDIAELVEQYKGKRIRLINMSNDPRPITTGEIGTCYAIDGMGQLQMKWDGGRNLALIPNVDVFEVVTWRDI